MRTERIGRLAGATLAVAALLAIGSVFAHSDTAAAQASGPAPVASVSCTPAPGNWTDCVLRLNQDVPAGGTVFVSLADQSVSVAFCWGGTLLDFSSLTIAAPGEESSGGGGQSSACVTNGHLTTFSCLRLCPAGSDLLVSVLGTTSSNLAQSLSVSVG